MSNCMVQDKKNECCGCSICMKICPVNAIKMEVDEEGFSYPQIDKNKCINCGLCKKNCAFANNDNDNKDNTIEKAYLAKHKKEDIRMNSRSGGIFVSASDWILKLNGVVYGCILDENMRAKHVRATKVEDRNKMCKSKYVESNVNNTFEEVEEDLKNGKKVLYSGTGCQIDSLIKFLKYKKANIENLYTIDIVCHGCVSSQLYNEYIEWLEKKHHGKITNFEFRDKTVCGWDGHKESYVVNGRKFSNSIYRNIFYTNLALRPSCSNCKYANIVHKSDLTIADAWGIDNVSPEFNDNKGVSMFLVQSQKGNELLEVIKSECDVIETDLKKVLQPNQQRPPPLKNNRDEFWDIYNKKGFNGILKKYGISYKKEIKFQIKYKMRQLINKRKQYLP